MKRLVSLKVCFALLGILFVVSAVGLTAPAAHAAEVNVQAPNHGSISLGPCDLKPTFRDGVGNLRCFSPGANLNVEITDVVFASTNTFAVTFRTSRNTDFLLCPLQAINLPQVIVTHVHVFPTISGSGCEI